VPIEIALSGTDLTGAPADYSTTVTGWVSATLSSQGAVGDALPYGWRGSCSPVIDHPDTVNPQWSLGSFSDVDIWDGNLPEPATDG
jgi:hypothetical protein